MTIEMRISIENSRLQKSKSQISKTKLAESIHDRKNDAYCAKTKYAIICDTIVLEFYDQKGDLGTENRKTTITIDRAKDAISLNGGKDFYSRVK
jgi:hypothetical protein